MIETKKSKKTNLENKRSTFFLIGLVLALTSVLLAFEWKTSETTEVREFGVNDFTNDDFIVIPSTPAEKKEPPKPIVEVPKFVLVDNDEDVDDIIMFSSEPEEFIDVDINAFVFNQPDNSNDTEEEIVYVAEVMPQFPGGERALISYLSRNVKYPLIAQENGVEGKVYVSFVVDEEGNILDVAILRGADNALDKEALRVVKGMPKWSPGKQGGKPVKVRYNVPIYFELR